MADDKPKRVYIWYCPVCGDLFYDPKDGCECKSIWVPVELDPKDEENNNGWFGVWGTNTP
jgi:uncharacterized OB-fold protein